MFVYVTTDDLHAALADINEGREVDWVAADGTPVTLCAVKSDNQEGVNG